MAAAPPPPVQSSTRSFVVSVSVPNEAPQLQPIGDKVAVIGETLSFTVRASDLEENPLAFTTDGLPAGATLTPAGGYGTAVFHWTPTAADAGHARHHVARRRRRQRGAGTVGTDAHILRVVVRNANQAPVLAAGRRPAGSAKATRSRCSSRRSTPTAIR